ncbi:MAG: hypothetical protein JWN72_2678 [Thermoleophilia bacterium]|nr:hypothetical protein [Thermoleophilia bacterium]
MRNHEIAAAFDELADRLALQDEKPYRYMAYRAASKLFRSMGESVQQRSEAGTLIELEGVGPAIDEKVRELLATGTFPALDKARAAVPDDMLALNRIAGIGPKSAQKIHAALAGRSVDELVEQAGLGTLQPEDGITAKFVGLLAAEARQRADGGVDASATEGIPRGADGQPLPGHWILRDQARTIIEQVAEELDALPDVADAAPSGAYARGREVVRGVTVVATSVAPDAAADAAAEHLLARGYERTEDAPRSPLLTGIDAAGAAQLDLVTPSGIGTVLVLATPAARALAEDQLAGPRAWLEHAAATSGEPAVPFELRERVLAGELAAADVPRDLVEARQLRGELHAHSEWSDGHHPIIDMARAARGRGDEYYLVSDHSAPYAMVGGLGHDRLVEQAAEIANVNEVLAAEHAAGGAPGSPDHVPAFRVLHGSEVEIGADGTLGLPDDDLAMLDWVVASIHISQRQTAEQLVARMTKVITNPLVDAIGHPTSRKLLARQRTALPIDTLIELAAAHDVVLEINAHPHRLDLDSEQARRALDAGVRLTVNTDAHWIHDLRHRDHGIAVARRAGARTRDVVNTLPIDELLAGRRRHRG